MPECNITKKGLKCNNCSSEWFPRYKEKPLICPKCKSSRWDREPKRVKKKEVKDDKPKTN